MPTAGVAFFSAIRPRRPGGHKRRTMDCVVALRSIRYDLLDYIQQKVAVDFHPGLQHPAGFVYMQRRHRVTCTLGRYRTRQDLGINGYLVQTESGQVFFLYFDPREHPVDRRGCLGSWVLSFRILDDLELMVLYREDRKMLLNMSLKRIVDFHGHLCPDLVIGAKVSHYAQALVAGNGQASELGAVVAENCTSAIDAIQVLLGMTMGNRRLTIVNYGKHNYTLIMKGGQTSYRLTLRPLNFADEDSYADLAKKIASDKATLDDVVAMQQMLDDRIRWLLARQPEDLFDITGVVCSRIQTEAPTVLAVCARCGQPVIRHRGVEYDGGIWCLPCFRETHRHGTAHYLH